MSIKRNGTRIASNILLAGSIILISGCATSAGSAPTAPAAITATNTLPPEPTPTARPPVFELTLTAGDFYFRRNDRQEFVLMRNVAGYQQSDYEKILRFAKNGGTSLARIQLDSYGAGYTISGKLDEVWFRKWEQVFDAADGNGVAVIPVFAGWFDWNDGTPDYDYSTWKSNPFNAALGGPAKSPGELFQPGTTTQKLWLAWVRELVSRWAKRETIVAWEIFSEVNIASGTDEASGVRFVRDAASTIRSADPYSRPLTASLADVGEWRSFYQDDAIDFINIHPYPGSGKLDTFLISAVRQKIADYGKPVMIGESGLSAVAPTAKSSTLTTAKNAAIGVRHAIWAGLVSGAMNGRGLYWEDGFGVYFPELSYPYLQKYQSADLPVAEFTKDMDFSSFTPLDANFSSKIVGAAVGSPKLVIGWARDAGCEPPDWPLQPVISGQSVTINAASNATWNVEFYDTRTGKDITERATVTGSAGKVVIRLPDFSDDIAFKMTTRD